MPQARSAAAPRSPRLRLYLLGAFRLEREISASASTRQRAERLHLPTRKREALLAYLLLYPEPHTRERLAALLWGDAADELARSSLRRALVLLRQALGQDLLVTDRASVQINPPFPPMGRCA